ncbi:MAG TPA: PIG-L family deacetylase [Candidatus Binatia bacterium]|jgi:LmbE family N-acetylglucosaminyl deacetylase|nr:PIG-L family deacetylase [Candidatus Binatia bacterium]
MRETLRPSRHCGFSAILASFVCFLSCSVPCFPLIAAEPPPASVILQDLRSFRQFGTVLYVAAHPDDENTQLITYFARGRSYRTAYLSITRGDGGQNVLGPEFGDELGVIRTQELLAARRLDGGRQFFTRAIDFGFSKSATETLSIWDRQQVVSDVVRIIRSFRPDVIITRFSPQPSGTHGHHTASAALALEAFKLTGNPKAFPEQLAELTPWQPKRILMNGGGFGRGGGNEPSSGVLHLDVSGNDPVTGESFADIAGRSRSMHKTQGFGNFTGGRGGGGARSEPFQLLGGEAATNDVFDGIDATWGRVSGGAEIGRIADEVIEKFDTNDPAASVPSLLKLRGGFALLPADRIVDEKRRQLDHIVQACVGLSAETLISQAEVVPGETMQLHHTAVVHSSVPVRWMAVRYPSLSRGITNVMDLHANQPAERDSTQILPASTPVSQPYWLRAEHTTGMFRVDDPRLIGRPENPPPFPVEQVFEIGGQTLVFADEPVQPAADTTKPENRRRLDVIPPVTLRFLSEVRLFSPGATRPVEMELTALRAGVGGTVRLDAPERWPVEPAVQPFHLEAVGDHVRLRFMVTAPGGSAAAGLTAHAEVKGARFGNQRIEIRYPHIPLQLLQPPARLEAVSLELAIRGKQVGYVPGAGDSVAEGLEQMGYAVQRLAGADLTAEKLKGLDAVVIGIRAFNVRTDLAANLPALFAYVEGGGNAIVQYNRPNDLKPEKLAPFELRVSSDRVTDENAPVTFLAPDHPALNTPNKITSADFEGWVQERGLYFPNQWDEHFTPLIACNDPGESPKKGGLLVARYGKGYFVYTGLAWFRQLPAAVPGAYRLFANLVSLGKAPSEKAEGAK